MTLTVMVVWRLKVTTPFITQAEFGGWLLLTRVLLLSEHKHVNKMGWAGESHWFKAEERKYDKDTETVRKERQKPRDRVEISNTPPLIQNLRDQWHLTIAIVFRICSNIYIRITIWQMQTIYKKIIDRDQNHHILNY